MFLKNRVKNISVEKLKKCVKMFLKNRVKNISVKKLKKLC